MLGAGRLDSDQWRQNFSLAAAFSTKQKLLQLDALEKKTANSTKSRTPTTGMDESALTTLVANIVNNISFRVSNVHIRLHCPFLADQTFSCVTLGIVLDQLNVESTGKRTHHEAEQRCRLACCSDKDWKATFVASQGPFVYKRAHIENLILYCSCNTGLPVEDEQPNVGKQTVEQFRAHMRAVALDISGDPSVWGAPDSHQSQDAERKTKSPRVEEASRSRQARQRSWLLRPASAEAKVRLKRQVQYSDPGLRLSAGSIAKVCVQHQSIIGMIRAQVHVRCVCRSAES